MKSAVSPADIREDLITLDGFWRGMELDAMYALSAAQSKHGALTATLYARSETVITRNLSRCAEANAVVQALSVFDETPKDVASVLLTRIMRVESAWRKIHDFLRNRPTVPDRADEYAPIRDVRELPGWLLHLNSWAQPESLIINDIEKAISNGETRPDEAFDSVKWSTQDDIAAIDCVSRLAESWDLDAGSRLHLRRVSEEARVQLTKLLAVIEKARPFSDDMRTSAAMARLQLAEGNKPN